MDKEQVMPERLKVFGTLLDAMLTKPPLKVLGMKAAKLQASSGDVSAGYSGTRTRAGKSASASLKRKRKSQKLSASS